MQETVPLLLLRQGGKLRHPLPDSSAARRGKPAHLRPMRQLRPSCDGVAPGDPGLLHHRSGSRHGGSTRCGRRNCSAQDRHRRAPERTSWNRRIFSLRKEGLRRRAALALARYFFEEERSGLLGKSAYVGGKQKRKTGFLKKKTEKRKLTLAF